MTGEPPSSAAPLDARTQRVVLSGMVAYLALGAFEALAVSTAMPTVAAELDGLRLYTYAFAATSAASVVGMLAAGRWADRRGPTPPLWAGIALFLTGLLVAGLAPSMEVLVAGRALQGAGAGLEGVALYVLVAHVFPEERRPVVFAWFAAAWVVPGAVGPVLAGLVTQHLGWRWVFLAVPALALPALLALRPGLAAARGARTTPPGRAVAARDVVVPVLRGARGLGAVVHVRVLASAAFVGAEVLLPLALVHERGIAPALAGTVLTLHVLGWSAGSWLRGRGLHGLSHVGFLRLGGALLAAGIAGASLLTVPGVPVAAAAAPWVLAGLGMGLSYPTLNLLALELAPPGGQGAAMSALQVSDALAAAVALAGTGALLWTLHDVVGLGAYAVCLALAAGAAALAAGLAHRTRPNAVTKQVAAPSLSQDPGDEDGVAPRSHPEGSTSRVSDPTSTPA